MRATENNMIDKDDNNEGVNMDITEFEERLATFGKWKNNIVNKFSLAKLGFIYTGFKDKVECVYCHGRLYNWETGDDPYTEHKRHFPQCPLILQLDQDNIHHAEPQYQELSARTGTYLRHLHPRTPNEMATAGFYYTGPADRVRCFHCGVVFRDWGHDDDPFEVHTIFSPVCAYIRNMTPLQMLGICVSDDLKPDDRNKLESEIIQDQIRRNIADEISPNSHLFKQLLEKYDEETIFREMVVRVKQTGRNFHNREEFASWMKKRQCILSQKNQSIRHPLQIKAENERLRADKVCQICKTGVASVLFLPCGHLVTCGHCGMNRRDCFMCKDSIQGRIPVYRS